MDKNEALKLLVDSKPSCAIRMMADSCLGENKGNIVWNRAAEYLSEITNRYPTFTKEEYVHAKGIFNASALYLSLKETAPDKALEIIEEGMASYARKAAKTYQRMVKLPFGRTIFLKGFAQGAKTMFGESAGFKQQFHHADGNALRFDVLGCPYVKYTTELGCPEIAHIFCNNDIYAYAYLKGITFERTQTLGFGGTKCDFYLYKSK
jgi:hypothetical protein